MMQRRRAALSVLTLLSSVLASSLSACGGVPLTSLPRLMRLQDTLLDLDPAEFALAIQADDRMEPPAGASPVMTIAIRPAKPGGFEAVERRLPMRVAGVAPGASKLPVPPAGRRWLLYTFAEASQRELSEIQSRFRQLKAQGGTSGGGSVAVGIEQHGVAARDPALADTRWESWLQTSYAEGFYELWSGTIATLLKQSAARHA